MYWDILDEPRKKILPVLSFARSHGFYLAGGTALALQLGHRLSVDFDFYAKNEFDEMAFESDVVKNLQGFKVSQRSSGTLVGQVGVVDISFFHYSYPTIGDIIKTDHIDLVSVADIAAMKIIAISQRGLRRDFLDLYSISKTHPLSQVFTWAQQKFSQFDPHVCLKALTYFKDADDDESGRGMELIEPVSWTMVKGYFEGEAVKLAKQLL
jgi:predicted nucleotidyltransferase component of viral defense system